MNTIKTNDVTRELSDAELASVAGGSTAKIWMRVMDATPSQGEDRASGTPTLAGAAQSFDKLRTFDSLPFDRQP